MDIPARLQLGPIDNANMIMTTFSHRFSNQIVGCAAALVALAVHGSMDFIWHVPLIPLCGAVFVGVLFAEPADREPSRIAEAKGIA